MKPKIAWASVGETYYSLIEGATMLLDTNYFFTSQHNIYYLLGILNSRLITFWINSEDTLIGSSNAYRHYKYNLEKLNVPDIKDVSIIENKVLHILECISKGSDITVLENELNTQIYHLYNLSPNEIAFIESL